MLSDEMAPPMVPVPSVNDGMKPVVNPIAPNSVGLLTGIR
jgi:hypothetical protein